MSYHHNIMKCRHKILKLTTQDSYGVPYMLYKTQAAIFKCPHLVFVSVTRNMQLAKPNSLRGMAHHSINIDLVCMDMPVLFPKTK